MSKWLLTGARDLAPLQQGHLNALCGLYSIINAIQLAAYPAHRFSPPKLTEIFRHGAKLLDTYGKAAEALSAGMSERTWMRLCKGLIILAGQLSGVELERRFPLREIKGRNSRRALAEIKRNLRAGRPVLICLFGIHDHYTVLAGYSSTRLQLFDSSGLHWISIANCGVHHVRSTKRHQISRHSLMTIHAVPDG